MFQARFEAWSAAILEISRVALSCMELDLCVMSYRFEMSSETMCILLQNAFDVSAAVVLYGRITLDLFLEIRRAAAENHVARNV